MISEYVIFVKIISEFYYFVRFCTQNVRNLLTNRENDVKYEIVKRQLFIHYKFRNYG